ncbi:BafA family autotransporter [Bartonella heixiaziensis]|uniref:BafA family autotransporter n=1 Tax=Bartonella heixiaziensis TaxID=1461000 RepID=UPI003908A887
MLHKCKLGFSILMISSYLVQIANAVEKRNEVLTNITSLTGEGKVPKGSVLISNLLSTNAKIEDGGAEIVENGTTSIGATVDKGGIQIVTREGTAMDTKIQGGKQFVFEEKNLLDLTSLEKRSSAYNATVFGSNGAIGQQNVSDGGTSWYTKVMQGGEQNLYMGHKKTGGAASDTTVSEDGRQHVLPGGAAKNTTLGGSAIQVVYPSGIVEGLTINDSANSWVYVGAELRGEIKVNDKGHLHLYAGDSTNHIIKQKLSVTERSDEELFLVGERNNNRLDIGIENLGGNGGIVSFTSIPYDPRHISLHVGSLSGNLHFYFNISGAERRGDYLSIGNSEGNHKISVADSGIEITGALSQKNSFITEINLITDRSKNEGANFTLTNYSGEEISAVDGGTYMYSLYKREGIADSSGDSVIWYLGTATEKSNPSGVLSQRGNKKQKVSSFSSANIGKEARRPRSSSQGGNSALSLLSSTGVERRTTQKPKERPPRHLREKQQPSVLSQKNQALEVVRPASSHHLSDENQQPVVSADAQSLVDQMTVRPSNQDRLSLQSRKELAVSHFLTTPSTDAVLSLSVAPQLVFHNELQTVRAGRGILDRNKKNAALWTHAIKSKENIATGHTDFKLEQTGITLGISGLSELMSGEFYIGGFGSYDQARVAHARGGISGINTYSIGAYATYFDHSGVYLDGVLKYNHYQNNLKAVSTNGIDIEGKYNQWALGASFEAGYRFEVTQSGWMQPYAQFTWLQAAGKEIKLSNKMIGNISPSISLRSEVGLSLGYEFGSEMYASSQAYITASWIRESKDNNYTTINKLHKFTTDLSGNAGKLGVGLSSLVSEKLKLYAEAHYIKGSKVKQSLQGILGVRYSF